MNRWCSRTVFFWEKRPVEDRFFQQNVTRWVDPISIGCLAIKRAWNDSPKVFSVLDHPNRWHCTYVYIYIHTLCDVYIYIYTYICIYTYIFQDFSRQNPWTWATVWVCPSFGPISVSPVTEVSCCWPLFFWFATRVVSFWRTALCGASEPLSLGPGVFCKGDSVIQSGSPPL